MYGKVLLSINIVTLLLMHSAIIPKYLVYNFQSNVSKTILSANLLYTSVQRYDNRISPHFDCIKIHNELVEKLQVKD